MTGQIITSDTIRFQCTSCRAELTVPARLAGVEGPCPSCSQTIQAPIPEAMYDDLLELPDVPWMTPRSRPQKEFVSRAILVPAPSPAAGPVFPPPMDEKNFKARLAIPLTEEPLDDSWKGRHRDLRRKTRRARKAEEVAQSFLDSRVFRIARVALILLSAGMLVWLFTYMQTHQWRLPGMMPDMANQRPDATSGASRPIGSDGNVFASDEDAEIPPAAHYIHGQSLPVGSSAGPLAGMPR